MEQRTFLEEYYGGAEVLTGALGLQPRENGYSTGVDFIASKMARAMVWEDAFIISTIGSSVTSAHDNCNYDSYQKQLERLLSPLWDMIDVKFEVRNAGIGGRCKESYKNRIWCLSHILGNDTDIAHYSWTYFEAGQQGKPDTDPTLFHEMFIRWALLMDKSPAPQFLNVGAVTNQKKCRSCLDAKDGTHTRLFDKYSKYGVNILCLRPGIMKRGYIRKDREEKYCGSSCIGKFGDGQHNVTRYGESDSISQGRKHSLGYVYRNWHPGPLGFQVVSDSFGYYYMEAMLRAIEMIGDIMEKYPIAQLKKNWPRKPPRLTLNEIEESVYCDPDICNVDNPPVCLNMDEPSYGVSQIEPKPLDGWKIGRLVPTNPLVPTEEKHMKKCAHLDYCGGITPITTKKAKTLTFTLPSIKHGRIYVCFSQPDDTNKLQSMLPSILFQINKRTIDVKNSGRILWRKCIELQKKHSSFNDMQKKNLILNIIIDFEEVTSPVGISSIFAI